MKQTTAISLLFTIIVAFFRFPLAIASSTISTSSLLNRSIIPGNNTGTYIVDNVATSAHAHIAPDSIATAVYQLGIKWIRHDISWKYVEQQKGVYSWSSYDPYVLAFAQKGIKPLLIIDYSNPLYNGGNNTDNLVPTDPSGFNIFKQAYGAYAYQAALHFKGTGARFEIWNEPYVNRFWMPKPNATQYAELANYAVRQIHAADPQAIVTTASIGGPENISTTYGDNFLNAGGGEGMNAIAIHPYTRTQYPEYVFSLFDLWSAIIKKYFPTAPPQLWNSEWGYRASPSYYNIDLNTAGESWPTFHAKLVVRELLSTWVAGFPFSVYYELQDDPPNSSDWPDGGLYTNTLSIKPAGTAVQTMITNLAGEKLLGKISNLPTHEYGFIASNADKKTIVLWTDLPTNSFTVTIDKPATITNFLGQKITPSNNTIAIGNSPVYIALQTALPGDVDNDGKVDIFDYNILVSNFGHPYTIFDYNTLVENFAK